MTGPFRYKLLDLLKTSATPLNTCQVCRIIHGAKGKHDIGFCRPEKWDVRHDKDGFTRRNSIKGAVYENCKNHTPGYYAVYRGLYVLERKGFLETRIEKRNDPIVPTQKDRMRMWAYRGRLPRITNFLDQSSLLKEQEK